MSNHFRSAVTLFCLMVIPAAAVALEGEQLYRVATVRAAPGHLAEVLEWAKPMNETAFYVMRHSQGDHWDLLFLTPLDEPNIDEMFAPVADMLAFHEDTYAYGPSADDVAASYAENSLLHIEMFAAVAGKKAELLEQRRMENVYLAATGQTTNMIFRSVAGSDIDVFTIGFHEDLEAFAAPSPASSEESEVAAVEAGFKDRADISFYLRSLISSHHDTLAGKVAQ